MKIERFEKEYDFLSNFYLCPVELLEIKYKSAEHAYQAQKTKDPILSVKIQNCSTPGQAKRLGNKVPLRQNWDLMKDDIMFDVVMSKFSQNPDLAQKLLETGDAELVEGNSWNDTYWGICNGIGKNKLGKILMEARRKLKEK